MKLPISVSQVGWTNPLSACHPGAALIAPSIASTASQAWPFAMEMNEEYLTARLGKIYMVPSNEAGPGSRSERYARSVVVEVE